MRNEIIQGDCLEGMKSIADGSVDLVFTDPPYNIASEGSVVKSQGKLRSTAQVWGHYDTFESRESYLHFISERASEMVRILAFGGNLLCFCGKEYLNDIEKIFHSYGMETKNIMAIFKNNPLPNFRECNFQSGFELGIWLCKGKKTKAFNFLGNDRMQNYEMHSNGKRYTKHPNEKPLYVVQKWVSILSNRGDLVCDPFSGSGITSLACGLADRAFVGFEINEDYAKNSREFVAENLAGLRSQNRLFEVPVRTKNEVLQWK